MKKLHDWFALNRRDFPWRVNPTPYAVWISEVMLQQTRAAVVIPYFERWMTLFPNVEALAQAPIEQVIKAWEGLGYYSRARNLHKGAQQIVSEFQGVIPLNRKDLETIKGLGPYTVGAILSFGFHQRAAAVDGNVMRVLSRYLLIEENICQSKVKKKLFQEAELLLDEKEPWVTAEALIELGATICTPKPKCAGCPLQTDCKAFLEKKELSLPIKNEEKETTLLTRSVVCIESEGTVLVKKGEPGRVMADLYEFPFFELKNRLQKAVIQTVLDELGLRVQIKEILPVVIHSFTRFKAHLHPFRMYAERSVPVPGYEWVKLERLKELPFSSGHRKVLGFLNIVSGAITMDDF